MNFFKLCIFLLATFPFSGINTAIAGGAASPIASANSKSHSPQNLKLEKRNLRVVLRQENNQRGSRFNLNNLYANNSNPFAQVNSVSKLADIHSTDWSFQALQSLIQNYGCPVKSFYTKKRVSRPEFARNLSICLNHISQLITSSRENPLTKNDLATIQRLQAEFAGELAIQGNYLEIANLGSNEPTIEQFSTTTKLNAEAIFTFIGSNNPNFKGNRDTPERTNSDLRQSTLGYRTTLNFDTSFTGRDQLRTRFRAGEIISPFLDQTNMGGLETSIGTEGDLKLTKLQYRSGNVPFIYDKDAEKFTFVLSAFGTGLDEQFFETFNPYITGSKDGFTQFAIYNPIFRQPRGVGASIGYIASDRFRLAIGYSARGSLNEAADPSPGRGLFNGSFSTGVNTQFELTDNWMLGLTYLYSYSAKDLVFLFGQTGSTNSSDPFNGNPTQAHNFGLQTTALINSKFNLAGWFGWSHALDASSDNEADILNWGLTFVVLDAFKEGNKAGLVVGMPPKLTSIKNGNPDPSNAWQIEAFYTHQVNDNIYLNPGFYVIVNPENDSRNNTIFVGLLRTTFEF